MATIDKRLDQLEAAINPPTEKPLIVLHQQDGITWATKGINYRAAFDPSHPEAIIISPVELAELELTHTVILIQYVDMDMTQKENGPESDI